MGNVIRTVLGDIGPEALGLTSMHDHLFYDGTAECLRLRGEASPGAPPRDWFPMRDDDPVSLENVGMLQRNAMFSLDAFRQTDEALLEEELRLYRAAGGGAILSLGTRAEDGPALRRLSEAAGVHIVASAGFGPTDGWTAEERGRTEEERYAALLDEAERAPVRPGHLTVTLRRADRDEESALRAAVRCARETGLCLTICLRGNAAVLARFADERLRAEGLSPRRVVFSDVPLFTRPGLAEAIRNPASVAPDTALARKCLDDGYHLAVCITNAMDHERSGGYDCGDFLSFAGLYALVEHGYCKQLVLGSDCRGKITLHGGGGEGYCRLPYYVLPMLRGAAGLSDYAIRRMTVENPAELLTV